MADDLTARVQSLNTERNRPAPDLPNSDVASLIGDLIAALHSLYRTPPDKKRTSSD